MNFKKIITTAVAVAALAGFSGVASAAVREVNVYGASAQYLYWEAQAANYLQNIGCYNNGFTKELNSKNMVAMGDCANGDTFIFRVSSKASYDGPLAVMGNITDPNRGTNSSQGCGDAFPTQRMMVDEATCSGATCTGLKCVEVTIGASDVEGESFTQRSNGQLDGPNGGGVISRLFNSIDTSSLSNVRKMVVPFGFFVNNSVTKDGFVLDNITRHQAVMIYSGQAFYWQDFGAGYNTNPIVACLRHAGSGTHATIDKTVMHGAWGGNLVTNESASDPTVWFNDGSSDLMKCTNQEIGAIGYSNADHISKVGDGNTYPNITAIAYNGVMPTRVSISTGEYDNFWAVQNCYHNSTDTEAAAACASVDNVPASKAAYWATTCEMTYMKDKDANYPQYVGPSCEAGPSCVDGLDNDFDGLADAADPDCQ